MAGEAEKLLSQEAQEAPTRSTMGCGGGKGVTGERSGARRDPKNNGALNVCLANAALVPGLAKLQTRGTK